MKKRKKELKKYNLKSWVFILLFILCLFLFIFSVFKLVNYFISTKEVNKLIDDINNTPYTEYTSDEENVELVNPPQDDEKTISDYWTFINTSFLSVDFNKLIQKNKDTVAWIKINNTNINYPVVQTTNNDYYLKRAFDNTWNEAGWLFMDYKNDPVNWSDNTIIYGHSMLNTTMFGSLYKVQYSSWFNNKDNLVIKISTPTENTLWQIFSIYKIEAENYYITTTFNTSEEKVEFLNTIKSRSINDFGTTLNENDKILTLSTCASSTGNTRLVVHAKLIKRENR